MHRRKHELVFPHGLTGMPEIISRIHWHRGMSRNELDRVITKELEGLWIIQLSEPQRAMIAQGKWDELPHQAWSKLDRTIVKQAETLGWRLLVSTLVLKSFRRWTEEATGPELFEALGKALARSVRILQRRELPPSDNLDLISTEEQTICELRIVRREMRKKFAKKRRSPNPEELLASFVKIVSNSRMGCSLLRANVGHWLPFLENHLPQLSELVRSGRPAPAALFHEWLAECKGHHPETLRKKISSMRSSVRSQ